jgi:hypothetical protein
VSGGALGQTARHRSGSPSGCSPSAASGTSPGSRWVSCQPQEGHRRVVSVPVGVHRVTVIGISRGRPSSSWQLGQVAMSEPCAAARADWLLQPRCRSGAQA